MLKKFAKDIVVIDGREYRRDDLDEIMDAFAGCEETGCAGPDSKAFIVDGEHTVFNINVNTFIVEYDENSGVIMDYILIPSAEPKRTIAVISDALNSKPDIYRTTGAVLADYPMGEDRKITLAFTAPETCMVFLLWT